MNITCFPSPSQFDRLVISSKFLELFLSLKYSTSAARDLSPAKKVKPIKWNSSSMLTVLENIHPLLRIPIAYWINCKYAPKQTMLKRDLTEYPSHRWIAELCYQKWKDLVVCNPICFQECSILHLRECTYTYAAVTAKYRTGSKHTLSFSNYALFM